MKSNKKRIRVLRHLAVAGCLAALAVPATAAAKPIPADPPMSADPAIAVRHENGPATQQQPYTLPSGFHTEIQSVFRGSPKPFTLPAGFKPEVQQGAPSNSTPSSSPSPVVREIRTVTHDDGRTLAIVLASLALAIALGCTAYGAVRLTRMQRRVVGS
jgi:hypothetical protein